MPYNQALAAQVKAQLAGIEGFSERVMFGGIGYMLRGNLACGVIGDNLIVRVGLEAHAEALSRPGARVFDYSGRPMAGWVTVEPQGTQTEAMLREWVQIGAAYAGSLPAK
jgi:TfoX/Sxy family transcriptional regulator of competence genes